MEIQLSDPALLRLGESDYPGATLTTAYTFDALTEGFMLPNYAGFYEDAFPADPFVLTIQ